MILPLLLLAAIAQCCSSTFDVPSNLNQSQHKFVIEDKHALLRSLLNETTNYTEAHIFLLIQNIEHIIHTVHLPSDPLEAAQLMHTLISMKQSNPFHTLIRYDNVYGGSRVDLEMLEEIINDACDALVTTHESRMEHIRSRTNATTTYDNKSKDLKFFIELIRSTVRKFLVNYEQENPYWTNGLVERKLNKVSFQQKYVAYKARSIAQTLSKIMTRDQFVIIVTNLKMMFPIQNAHYIDAHVSTEHPHTIVVMRIANKSSAETWQNATTYYEVIPKLFRSKNVGEKEFYRVLGLANAASGGLFCAGKSKAPEITIIREKNDGSWEMSGMAYASTLGEDTMKKIVEKEYGDCHLVLTF